jgi:membrane protease subunit HflK
MSWKLPRLRSLISLSEGNDPRQHRRPGASDGPPDLEELWQDFNQRLGRLFSRMGAKGPSPAPRDPGQNRLGVMVVVGIVVFVWMCTGIYTVQEGQVGVVSTFGKYASTTGPGLRWRAPWPVQANEIVDVFSQRKIDVGMRGSPDRLKESLMLTDDENIVDMQFEVQYRVKDGPEGARDYIFGSRFSAENKDADPGQVVLQSAESAMREVVGRRKMDDVLFGSRLEIADEVRQDMQVMLDRYTTGLLVTQVAIQNAQPPDEVQAAFDDASKAVQDRERLINEGQAYANDVVPRARGNAARLIQEAEAYRVKSVETAQGDASRFRQILTEYAKAPGVTRERMYLETMQQIFSNTSKLMVDSHSSSQLLYLPLDKLIQQSAPGGDANASASGTPAPAHADAAPAVPERSREAGRARDREGR